MTTAFTKQTIIPITELEQSAFCQTDGNLRTKTLEEEFSAGVRWQKVPTRYLKLTPEEISEGIAFARNEIGEKAVLLGHHYQRDDVIEYADFTGDSYKLSKMAAAAKDAKWIIFCGVHFMAETADILARDDQAVILPNLAAGCSMADMADEDSVEAAWEELVSVYGTEPDESGRVPVIPVTYMNSSAALKAFCGKHGGIVCTSSNAATVLEWAFERGQRVLFFPDQHLGRNTGVAMGYGLDEMVVWNPRRERGGLDEAEVKEARFLLWRGHCSVHQRFGASHIDAFRSEFPDGQVIVHPECNHETVLLADQVGSTDFIIRTVEAAAPGSAIGIGTEIHLVHRLAAGNPDKHVVSLDPMLCPCSTMFRIDAPHLAWVLEGLVEGEVRKSHHG